MAMVEWEQRLRRGRMMLVSALATGAERREFLKAVPLRCWDARRHVSDYLDGLLDDATRAAVEAHVEHCPTCPALVASLVSTTEALAARSAEIGEGHAPYVMRRVSVIGAIGRR